jgi:PleD family two-component response regulator
VIIAENTGLQASKVLAEKLFKVFENSIKHTHLEVTVFIGVAQIKNVEVMQSWISRTDLLLLLARH